MLRPFRITLDRFINRRRSKDIYETVFFPFFHIFPAFLQNRLSHSSTVARWAIKHIRQPRRAQPPRTATSLRPLPASFRRHSTAIRTSTGIHALPLWKCTSLCCGEIFSFCWLCVRVLLVLPSLFLTFCTVWGSVGWLIAGSEWASRPHPVVRLATKLIIEAGYLLALLGFVCILVLLIILSNNE